MSYNWSEVFKGVDAGATVGSPADAAAQKRSWLSNLREGLSRSRKALGQQLSAVLVDRFDEELWERIEEALIFADVGVDGTVTIVQRLEEAAEAGEIQDSTQLISQLRDISADVLEADDHRIDVAHDPAVLLITGVNGTGKTTTIGKIAWHLKELGRRPLLVAGDTFRAAAVEQLVEWGNRVGCDVIRQDRGGDPGAVVYDGIAAARSRDADVVIIDTAGRLHTQTNLMRELEKVVRVIKKQAPEAPHEVLLTIDATTGQNGLVQAKLFQEAVGVTGVVLTKMDGTARGGIAIAITHELGLPIKLIGTGEKLEDLRPFDPAGFSSLLFDEEMLLG